MKHEALEIGMVYAKHLQENQDEGQILPVLSEDSDSAALPVQINRAEVERHALEQLKAIRAKLTIAIITMGAVSAGSAIAEEPFMLQFVIPFTIASVFTLFSLTDARRLSRTAINCGTQAKPALEPETQPRVLVPQPALVSPGLAEVSSDAGAESHPGRMTGDELAEALAEHMKRTTEAEIAAAQLRATPLGERDHSK